MSKNDQNFDRLQDGRRVFLERPGGMRWPPGGIIGGAKNTLFEIWHIMAGRILQL